MTGTGCSWLVFISEIHRKVFLVPSWSQSVVWSMTIDISCKKLYYLLIYFWTGAYVRLCIGHMPISDNACMCILVG